MFYVLSDMNIGPRRDTLSLLVWTENLIEFPPKIGFEKVSYTKSSESRPPFELLELVLLCKESLSANPRPCLCTCAELGIVSAK